MDFYLAIQDDNRIGATHISLYLALYYFYALNQFQNPVFIKRTSVMYGAKICGLATYHKCIKDLNNFGYISYRPSYNPGVRSECLFGEGGVAGSEFFLSYHFFFLYSGWLHGLKIAFYILLFNIGWCCMPPVCILILPFCC